MSWFSELTSKAEAMLVKLDQDAAQALQNPDGILARTRLIEGTKNTLSVDYNDNPTSPHDIYNDTARNQHERHLEILEPLVRIEPELDSSEPQVDQLIPELTDTRSNESDASREDLHRLTSFEESIDAKKQAQNPVGNSQSQQKQLENHARQFRLQTNSITRSSTTKRQRGPNKFSQIRVDERNTTNTPYSPIRLDADDIRASINRTLLEYSEYLPSSINKSQSRVTHTSNTSFYDQQPNLATSSTSESQTSVDNFNSLVDRPNRSNSFSIDVPDDRPSSNTSDAITVRLLEQGSLRKKSTFYLHKVINRLANQSTSGRDSVIEGYLKIKLRRAQMRAASYARRLNYYFRTYPQMKYVMVGYIIAMQLLVVYVLFFYQSSSTKVGLSQFNNQPGLAEPQMR